MQRKHHAYLCRLVTNLRKDLCIGRSIRITRNQKQDCLNTKLRTHCLGGFDKHQQLRTSGLLMIWTAHRAQCQTRVRKPFHFLGTITPPPGGRDRDQPCLENPGVETQEAHQRAQRLWGTREIRTLHFSELSCRTKSMKQT